MSAIDAAFASSAAQGKKRTKGVDSFDTVIRKICYDTLGDMTAHELDAIRDDDGNTARDLIIARKKLHDEQPKRYPMGKLFYSAIRSQFRSEDSPQKKLKACATACKDAYSDNFLKAVISWQKTNSRTAMVSWLEITTEINEAEFIGVAKLAIEVKPAVSQEQFKTAQRIMEALARLRVSKTYEKIFVHMSAWASEFLCCMLSTAKGNLRKPSVFVSTNLAIVTMVLPEAPLKRILSHAGVWATLEADLVLVVEAAPIGAKLFGFIVANVLGERVEKEFEAHVKLLLAEKVVTADIVLKHKQAAYTAIQLIDGINMLPAKRVVQLEYRGRSFEYKVIDLMDHLGKYFMSKVKEAMVGVKNIPVLLCEDELAVDPQVAATAKFDSSLRTKITQARETINAAIAAASARNGPAIVSYMDRNSKMLHIMDPYIGIETEFFRGMVGADGRKALQTQLLALVPNEAHTKTIDDTLKLLTAMQLSSLYKFCDPAAQNEVIDVGNFLSDLLHGRAPTYGANPNEFMQSVRLRLAWFCRCTTGENTLYGAQACKAMLDALIAKDIAAVSVQNLEDPVRFAWLLSMSDAAKLSEVRSTVLDKISKTLATAATTAKKVPKTTKTRKGEAMSSTGASSSTTGGKKKLTELESALAFLKGED